MQYIYTDKKITGHKTNTQTVLKNSNWVDKGYVEKIKKNIHVKNLWEQTITETEKCPEKTVIV